MVCGGLGIDRFFCFGLIVVSGLCVFFVSVFAEEFVHINFSKYLRFISSE